MVMIPLARQVLAIVQHRFHHVHRGAWLPLQHAWPKYNTHWLCSCNFAQFTPLFGTWRSFPESEKLKLCVHMVGGTKRVKECLDTSLFSRCPKYKGL